MSFTFSEVDISSAAKIAQYVDVPAMQNGPLYRTMFPQADTMTTAERDEVVRWYAEMLADTIQDGSESLLQVCSPDDSPIGFCGWSVEQGERMKRGKHNKKNSWVPGTLDIYAWITLSKVLRAERDRVLKDIDGVHRLTLMAVDPSYQRQGIGSMLMRRVCEEADQQRHSAYVLAAPEGVRLYAKFGFEVV